MHKKFGFYIGLISLVMMGCQTEGTSQNPNFVLAEKCAKNGGVFNFKDDLCKCGTIECPKGSYCEKIENSNGIPKCIECEPNETKCENNAEKTCGNDKKWNEPKCCGDLGCNLDNGTCYECSIEDENKSICFYNDNLKNDNSTDESEENNDSELNPNVCKGEPKEIKKIEGNIYQCKGGYLVETQTCANGCNVDDVICKECQNNETKCITYDEKTVVLTCKNGFWPKLDGELKQDESIKIYDDKVCDLEEKKAVSCVSASCIKADDWNTNLSCEEYKAIIIAHLNQLDGLKKESIEQLYDWFEFEFNSKAIHNPDNTSFPICNFSGTREEEKTCSTYVNNCENYYKNCGDEECESDSDSKDKHPLPMFKEISVSNKNLNEKYNCMRYEYNCTPSNTVSECIEFVNKYMCEFENYYDNDELVEFKGLFKIKPNDIYGAIVNCNPDTKTWDVNDITTCLKPEYEYVPPKTDQEEQELPEYHVKFTSKACADPLEGAKYSTACAINDKD